MSEGLEPVCQFLPEELGISLDSQIEREYPIHIGDRELHVGIAIKSMDTMTIIEIKSIINEDTIYRIYVLSHLMDKKITCGRKLKAL